MYCSAFLYPIKCALGHDWENVKTSFSTRVFLGQLSGNLDSEMLIFLFRPRIKNQSHLWVSFGSLKNA